MFKCSRRNGFQAILNDFLDRHSRHALDTHQFLTCLPDFLLGGLPLPTRASWLCPGQARIATTSQSRPQPTTDGSSWTNAPAFRPSGKDISEASARHLPRTPRASEQQPSPVVISVRWSVEALMPSRTHSSSPHWGFQGSPPN